MFHLAQFQIDEVKNSILPNQTNICGLPCFFNVTKNIIFFGFKVIYWAILCVKNLRYLLDKRYRYIQILPIPNLAESGQWFAIHS